MGFRSVVRRVAGSLTAAGGRMLGRGPGTGGDVPFGSFASGRSTEAWEVEAVDLFDRVPELRYGISWIAQSASRARLVTARRPSHPGGEPEPVPVDHPANHPLLELAPAAPDQAALIQQIVTLLKLTGRWRLVGFDDPVCGGSRRWMVMSDREWQVRGGTALFRHPDTLDRMELDSERVWDIPMWFPHPVWSHLPDSPVRSLIDTLHELLDLSGHVQTAARSRIAGAGILLMPGSLSPTAPGKPTGVNPPEGSPVMRALMRTAQTSLRSPKDVSRHLPVMVSGAPEALNAVRHLPLNTPFDERVDELRTSAIKRIATGLDIPPEILVGMSSLNHWTAYQISHDAQQVNVAPTLAFVCQQLSTRYLVPALKARGEVSDPEEYVLWYDDAAMATSPTRAPQALEAYAVGVISAQAAREAMGFGPADAPEPGQIDAEDGARARAELLTRLQEQRDRRLRRAVESDPAGAPVAQSRPSQGPAPTREVDGFTAGGAEAAGWVACAEVAALRALTRAGNKLLGAAGRAARGAHRDVPLHEMHTRLHAGDEDTARGAVEGAFCEVEAAAPVVAAAVREYVMDRLVSGQPHDVSVLAQFVMNAPRE